VLPVASAPLRSDWARVLGGSTGDTANFVTRAPTPPLAFIWRRDGGPHAIVLAVRPRLGRVTDSGSVVGPIRGEIKLTISLQKAREASCTLAVTSSGNSSPDRIGKFTLFVQRRYYSRHISKTEGTFLV
jgi:hypothetical protein